MGFRLPGKQELLCVYGGLFRVPLLVKVPPGGNIRLAARAVKVPKLVNVAGALTSR